MTQIDEISQIVSAIPPLMLTSEVVNIPEDEVAFVSAYETNNEHLVNNTVPELNALKTQFNTSVGQINTVAQEIQDIGENAINAITFDNIAQLKLNSNMGRVDVLGYYTKGDGGGGTFYWDSASTETDNGGTIIQADGVTTGRWKRVFSGAVNVKWFGAGTTNDTDIIQNIIDNVSCYEVYFPLGTYYLTSITIPNDIKNIALTGDSNRRTTLKQISGAVAPLIRFGASNARYNIGFVSNLKLEGTSRTNEAIHLRNTARGLIRNVEITNFDKGLYLSGSQLTFNESLQVTNCNTGVYIRKELTGDTSTAMPNLNTFNDCQITGCQNYAIDFDDGAGLKITNSQIDFNGVTGESDIAICIRSNASTETGYSKVPALYLDNVWIEGNKGANWLRVDNGGVFMQNCQSYSNDGGAFINTNNPCTVINCTGSTYGDTFKLLDSNKFGTFINSIFQSNIIGVNSSQVTTKISPFTININSTNGTEGFIGKPAFSAYASSNQSLTTGVFTKVPLGFKEYDKNNNFDTTSYAFTAPMEGVYSFNGLVWVEGTITRIYVSLYKNGSRVKDGTDISVSSTSAKANISVDLNLAKNDIIEMYVYASGSGLQLRGTQYSSYLTGNLVLGA